MSASKKTVWTMGLLVAPLLTPALSAAVPGITGPAFNLEATESYIAQPDGRSVYSWGYGCNGAPSGFLPTSFAAGVPACPAMQIPGPTLIVTQGQSFTVTLTNNLPPGAGNTSMLFPGLQVTSIGGGVAGLLTQEAEPSRSVTYTVTATTAGTHSYSSGTEGDLQIEMGLYGAIVVLPDKPVTCAASTANLAVEANWGEKDWRLATSAYDHPATCYDREYLFQFSEMDPRIHAAAKEQVAAIEACLSQSSQPTLCPTQLDIATEPYRPTYFLVNGRSMPDDMDRNYDAEYPHQPYNANPHMHPGELVLLRLIGQGRWQHPFYEDGNHVRILARDGNLLLSQADSARLAGPLLFTTTTTPGMAMDGLFYFTGKGLNWDMYGHTANSSTALPCYPDANGYNTGLDPSTGALTHPEVQSAINYYEWCADHLKPLEKSPSGEAGGPVTLPDVNYLTGGVYASGSPYLGHNAAARALGVADTTAPAGKPSGATGFAYMWHSHNEREIATNNIFPGGMLTMTMVDSREVVIDESK